MPEWDKVRTNGAKETAMAPRTQWGGAGRNVEWAPAFCFLLIPHSRFLASKKALLVWLFTAKNLVRKSQWGDKHCKSCTEFPGKRLVRKPRQRKGPFACIVGGLVRHSHLSRRPPHGAAAIFRGGVVCPLGADVVDASCFFSLQMDEQLRLNYNFSPEVEFRAVRSLTLGKVTGLSSCPLGFVKIHEWINDFHQDIKWFQSRTTVSGMGEAMICVWWLGMAFASISWNLE